MAEESLQGRHVPPVHSEQRQDTGCRGQQQRVRVGQQACRPQRPRLQGYFTGLLPSIDPPLQSTNANYAGKSTEQN
jgi:hypothetical protein